MSRRIVLQTGIDDAEILMESLADNESQLQELVKDNPDLMPVDDLGLTGPLLVIGKETALPAGSADLIALSQEGSLILVEFKTGPNNSDFRAAIAQLLDYGTGLWGLDWDSFQRQVPLRYFKSDHCADQELSGFNSLMDVLTHRWSDLDKEALEAIQVNLQGQLKTGRFHYVLVAQRFTDPILRTMDYLNEVSTSRFYAVEVVRFGDGNLQAFEARLIKGPPTKRRGSGGDGNRLTNETEFLDQFSEGIYRDAIGELLHYADETGYKLAPGRSSYALRKKLPNSNVLVTVGWISPPEKRTGAGSRDVTFGTWTNASNVPNHIEAALKAAFARYTSRFGELETMASDTYGVHLTPQTYVENQREVFEALDLMAGEIDKFSVEPDDV